jgi:hypothetical protein
MTIEEKYNWLLSKLSYSYDYWENDGLLVMKDGLYFQSGDHPDTLDDAVELAICAEKWTNKYDNSKTTD